MRILPRFSVLLISTTVLIAVPGSAQRASAPKARYAMDVATVSGFAAMGGGMRGGLGMLLGGGMTDNVAYNLNLRLGSSVAPVKPPVKADHFFLPAVKAGKSATLHPPATVPVGEHGEFERPKGRLLLFWGCGAKAAKGQPVIIDFAKMAAGQIPPGLFSSRVPTDRGPTASNSTYFAEWPNPKSNKQPGSGSSLLGDHRIAGNFAPEIKFALAQDYMPAVNANMADQAGGSILLSWNAVAPATGYVAWTFGGNAPQSGSNSQDVVWWTSASAREFGGGLWDWLPPATVRQLITEKIVMPPSQTSCQIPAEVKAASGGFLFGNLNAFGPEANFSFPPKPADPKAAWNIDWTARVRFRSHTSLMSGEGMNMGGSSRNDGANNVPEAPKKKKPCKGPFGIPIPGTEC